MVRVRGSYALEVMLKDYPGEIRVCQKRQSMIIGITDGETYVHLMYRHPEIRKECILYRKP